jgi:murein tripeptide amidase MpaA
MMKGIIDFLLSDTEKAKTLRDSFVFKIVPMLNMDGVIEGNHRFGIVPADLNRHWIHPDSTLHPSIHATKQLIMHIQSNVTDKYCFYRCLKR